MRQSRIPSQPANGGKRLHSLAGRLAAVGAGLTCLLLVPSAANAASTITTSTQTTSFHSVSKHYLHYANSHYWVALRDGTSNLVYSSPDGAVWSSQGTIFSFNAAARHLAVRFSGDTIIAFAYNTVDTDRYYRKGILRNDGTIFWVAEAPLGLLGTTHQQLNGLIANDKPVLWRAGAANTDAGRLTFGNQLDSPVVWVDSADAPALSTGLPANGTLGAMSAGAILPVGGADPEDVIVLRAMSDVTYSPGSGTHRLVAIKYDAGGAGFDAQWYSVSTLGGTLTEDATTEVMAQSDTGSHGRFAAVRDSYGNIHAAYVNQAGQVVHYRKTAGLNDFWSLVSSNVSQAAASIGHVALTAGVDGTLHLFYEKSDQGIHYRRYDGAGWGAESTLKATVDTLNIALGSMESAESCGLGVAWNENTVAPYEVMFETLAAGCGQTQVLSGSYVGNAANGRSIYVGFAPDVVMIKADAAQLGVVRTSTMSGNVTKSLYFGPYPLVDRIQSLDASGFTVGNNPEVNAAATTYYWVAFKAAPGQMKVGTYLGNDADNSDITGVGFQPDYLLIVAEEGHWAWHRYGPIAGDRSMTIEGGIPGGGANRIQAFLPDGFQLGDDLDVNDGTPLTRYHYIAWNSAPGRVAVGSYAGNGTPGRSISGAGFMPEYVLVSREQTDATVHKPASTGITTDTAQSFNAVGNAANSIQALQADGFQVGNNWDVNQTGANTTYYWAAFGPHTPQTNYRSIGDTSVTYGTFPPATLGNGTNVSVTNASATVGGVGATTWLSNNRGRGDVITIPCPDPPTCTFGVHYTIFRVVSNGSLQLTEGYRGGNDLSISYLIRRQFSAPQAWENCIDGQGVAPPAAPCFYFTAPTASLVADDRREVGVAYRDLEFTTGVTFSGAITDATHTITLTADAGNQHLGLPGTGARVNMASNSPAIWVQDDWVTVEWLELRGGTGTSAYGFLVDAVTAGAKTVIRNNLIHDMLGQGIRLDDPDIDVDIYNNMIYEVPVGIRPTMAIAAGRILNNTIFSCNNAAFGEETGINGPSGANITLRSNIVNNNVGGDIKLPGVASSSSHNLTGDGTATAHSPGGGDRPGVCLSGLDCVNFVDDTAPGIDLHLQSTSFALDKAADLSVVFSFDIDGGARVAPWDIGADDRATTTEVDLVSFEARGLDSAIELRWETASELDNLGFHLHRATADGGPYTRITSRPIPGLGSSPVGARYSYRDAGLTNGATYFYKLEDVATTGESAFQGPISATPFSDAPAPTSAASSLMTYGNPEASVFRVLRQTTQGVVLELTTEGFYAEPQEDGTVRLEIPGFEPQNEFSIPVLRPWVEALAGRGVAIASFDASSVESFTGLRPAGADSFEIVASREGTVRAGRSLGRRSRLPSFETSGLVPGAAARLLNVGFQGDSKKAQLELAPLRWNGSTGELFLARKLTVRLDFRGPSAPGHRERRSHRARSILARLVTTKRGLHELRYEDLRRRGTGIAADRLGLSRLGKSVAFHLEPEGKRFGPGSKLYFLSDGPDANPYGHEAVYELLGDGGGAVMELGSAQPWGEESSWYLRTDEHEENRLYQAGLLEAPDLWLWDILLAPVRISFSFQVTELREGPARLTLRLQGVSDSGADPDHHVRLYVNGAFQEELSWDGKRPRNAELLLLPGLLQEGENRLEAENVGDTGAPYSMVMVDRFQVTYPRAASADGGALEGRWPQSGTAAVRGLGPSHLVDVTVEPPRWLSGAELSADGSLRFRTEAERNYLAVSRSAVQRPAVRAVAQPKLKKETLRAEYLVIAPSNFSSTAAPLLTLRSQQGLRVKLATLEDVYSEFGFGEMRPEAIRDFLSYAYHHWQEPKVRYVLLLGDATYDFKDHLRTGVANQLPPLIVKTSYLWTVSDPILAAVNGDDVLPDVAIGRLPARDPEELRVMVSKLISYETGEADLGSLLVLVTDNPDGAGDFVRNAGEIARGALSGKPTRMLSLQELGSSMRSEILRAFDEGPSLVSYIGHGGIHLWAQENVFNTADVASLSPQSQQPLLLTMNCLNGYFHFPYFDALSEELLKAEGKGAIAAFSPSGLSLDEPAHRFHQALLDAVFKGEHSRLGDAVLAAQEVYASSGAFPELLTIYHLLGDPALGLR